MIEHNVCSNTPLSKEKLQQAINNILEETEDEERNANNVSTDTFVQPPVTTNAPREKKDVENERRIALEILTETIKGFNGQRIIQTKMSPKAIKKGIHW